MLEVSSSVYEFGEHITEVFLMFGWIQIYVNRYFWMKPEYQAACICEKIGPLGYLAFRWVLPYLGFPGPSNTEIKSGRNYVVACLIRH